MLKMTKMMRAVAIYKALPVSDINCLQNIDIPVPTVCEKDLLVEVKAISINPIDTKLRKIKLDDVTPQILGYDASGKVVDLGEEVSKFKVGDEVYFSGDFSRQGTYAQYTLVDESLVGLKPKTFSFEQAAALPVATMTSWDSLFDRLLISEKDRDKSILIINSAGGVGSVATQLAKRAGLLVIGTASRDETKEWTLASGADYVVDHKKDIIGQLKSLGFNFVDFILVNYDAYSYWKTIEEIIVPQGRICLIVDTSQPVDLRAFKKKSVTIASVSMMTRAMYNTADRIRYHEMLTEAAELFDKGELKGILTKVLSPFNAENIRKAHEIIENQEMVGKLVINDFS